jgi:DNA-directed RNA polymerase specialized sigma24 family protein
VLEASLVITTQDEGYELFRRAIIDRDADAWASISARYRPLMIGWIVRCSSLDASRESYENIADEALARAWRALTPARFQSFPNLPALLAYLRTCMSSTVIDTARRWQARDRACGELADAIAVPMEDSVVERLERLELWQLVTSLLKTEAERVVLYERFVLDLPPRIIQSRHPALFPEVTMVYATVHNLCDRLRRHKPLAQCYAELQAR